MQLKHVVFLYQVHVTPFFSNVCKQVWRAFW